MFQRIKMLRRGDPDTVVLGYFDEKQSRRDSAWKELDSDGIAASALAREESTGKLGVLTEAFGPAPSKRNAGGAPRWILVGLGAPKALTGERLEKAAAIVARHLARIGGGKARLALNGALERTSLEPGEAGRVLGETFGILTYDTQAWKGSATTSPKRPELSIRLGTPETDSKEFTAGFELGLALAESINVTRRLSESPPNVCTPSHVASEARKLARQVGLKCQVTPFNKLVAEELHGIHTVGRASENAPCLVRLEYVPDRARRDKKPAVLVGKTLTYDSGGLSIKTGGSMRGMKRDMDGGAGVLGAMHAIATAIRPSRRVIAYLCCAENAISDVAYRPDDIITYANGVTVEVTNTDAEGRLVLADGLIRAEREDPAFVVDMATLTGGVVVALGHTYAGMWCSDDTLRQSVEEASTSSRDRVWRLPLHDEYRDLMKSSVADIVNSAPVRAAHPIQGAAFLSYFIGEETPWCHLDIAGMSTTDTTRGPIEKSTATGFGVRLLADLIDRCPL